MNMHVSTASEAVRNVSNEQKYYDQLHGEKYRDIEQDRITHAATIAENLGSNPHHKNQLYASLVNLRFLPAGRVQAALGATEREVSPFNCAVSQVIEDDMRSIMGALTNAALILRLGTGIGYNFSRLRPKGAEIVKLRTEASGPLSFMKMFDVMASTIASSGHRRGAQMGILNVSHPDIEAFIDAKMEVGAFRQFNLSVGISDAFMEAVKQDAPWPLEFGGKVYKTVSATQLWEKVIGNAYASAEPGIIFIDRLNDFNNLYYCEVIDATNPCAEQPLPPHGLCLLGSFNLPAYTTRNADGTVVVNYGQLIDDIHYWVEAYDNIYDNSIYAIEEHKLEATSKRRMGLGYTGIASCIELTIGKASYGDPKFCRRFEHLAKILCHEAYRASINLAKTRGPFKLWDDKYLQSEFVKTLPADIQESMAHYGIRNSHLISYAPCGTISQCAGNVSSGVEPVFHLMQSRDVHMKEGKINVTINDYNYREYGFEGRILDDCTVEQHMAVAKIAQQYCDSAVSKTVNVAKDCTYEEYEQIYKQAHGLGLKGITVYRPNDLRGIVIAKAEETKVETPPEIVAFASVPSGCVNGACTL